MIYRRRIKSDVWHFHLECDWWPVFPKNKYVERDKKPTTGELCDRCLAKAKRAK